MNNEKITQIIKLDNSVVLILTESGKLYYTEIAWSLSTGRPIPKFTKWEEVTTEL